MTLLLSELAWHMVVPGLRACEINMAHMYCPMRLIPSGVLDFSPYLKTNRGGGGGGPLVWPSSSPSPRTGEG